MRYSTPDNWAKHFKESEGIQISSDAIQKRLKKAEIIGKTGRNKIRTVLRNAFFSESDVRSACADLLQPFPRADKTGFFMKDGEKYGTISAWTKTLGISNPSIVSRIKTLNPQCFKGRDGGGRICDFYHESAIREICADLLLLRNKADKNGFFEKDGQRYGTIGAWAKALKISASAIADRIKTHNPQSIKGKDRFGKISMFLSGIIIREICSDLLGDLPKADESGFFVKGDARFGTVRSISDAFGISEATIASRIKTHKLQCIEGKDTHACVRNFYSEDAIKEICADLLDDTPHADATKFIIKDNQRYGTIHNLSKAFGISDTKILTLVKTHKPQSIKGKIKGKYYDFFPEAVIRNLCPTLLKDFPQVDETGFFIKDGQKYATKEAWSRALKISTPPITERLKNVPLQSIEGKDKGGRIQKLYSESAIRGICSDLLQDISQTNEAGFFTKDGQRYSTKEGWAKLLGIPASSIKRRIKTHCPQSIKGKANNGRIRDFYPESVIRHICADILAKRKNS